MKTRTTKSKKSKTTSSLTQRISTLEKGLSTALNKISALELVIREMASYTDAISLDVDELLDELDGDGAGLNPL